MFIISLSNFLKVYLFDKPLKSLKIKKKKIKLNPNLICIIKKKIVSMKRKIKKNTKTTE